MCRRRRTVAVAGDSGMDNGGAGHERADQRVDDWLSVGDGRPLLSLFDQVQSAS